MKKHTHTHKSKVKFTWYQRVGNSLWALFWVPFFFILGFGMLYVAENRRPAIRHKLKQLSTQVKDETVAKDGDLVKVRGVLNSTIGNELLDKEFNVSSESVKLDRRVFMCQWEEKENHKGKKDAVGGIELESTYTYKKVWSSKVIRSSRFAENFWYKNPGSKTYPNQYFIADEVSVGNFILDSILTQKLEIYQAFKFDTAQVTLPKDAFLTYEFALPDRTHMHLRKIARTSIFTKNKKTPAIYIGNGTPNFPEIGDHLVAYYHIPEQTKVTVVAQKNGYELTPLVGDSLPYPREEKNSRQFYMLLEGEPDITESFEDMSWQVAISHIILRFMGAIFALIGFLLLGIPLKLLFSWIPFMGLIWEKLVFVLVKFVATIVIMSFSGYYFMKCNSVLNLLKYDFFFVFLFLYIVWTMRSATIIVRSNKKILMAEKY